MTDGVRGSTLYSSKRGTGSSPAKSNIGNEFHTVSIGTDSRSCTIRGAMVSSVRMEQICGEIQVLELIRFVEHNH